MGCLKCGQQEAKDAVMERGRWRTRLLVTLSLPTCSHVFLIKRKEEAEYLSRLFLTMNISITVCNVGVRA